MSKIVIDKQVILDRIAELEENIEKWSKWQKEGKYSLLAANNANTTKAYYELEFYKSILQQGEEYNENETKLIKPKQGSFDEEGYGVTRVIDDKQEEIWMPSDLDDWGKIFYKYDVSKYNNNDITDFRNWLKENYHPPVKK